LAATAEPHLICATAALVDGGAGVRFTVQHEGGAHPAFAVRYGGRVHAYINRCTHRSLELDWEPGRFYDADSRELVCATHGARYEPETGRCLAGPCTGGLVKLAMFENNGSVYLAAEAAVRVVGD
jgi:nitrite reductase/ring-hydroxylating ferredoxin subunit